MQTLAPLTAPLSFAYLPTLELDDVTCRFEIAWLGRGGPIGFESGAFLRYGTASVTFLIRDSAAAAAGSAGFSQSLIGVVSLSLSSSPGCYDVVDSLREKEANLLSIMSSVIGAEWRLCWCATVMV